MGQTALRVVSWNINQRAEPWHELENSDIDVALLQEAKPSPLELASRVEVDQPPPWFTAGAGVQRPWCAAIARLTDRVILHPCPIRALEAAEPGELGASRSGTLAVADVTIRATGEVVTLVSMYGVWESPAKETGGSWIYADASVHRLVSDLSALIGNQRGHRIIAAGDLNILYGYGEDGSLYWKGRYDTIFARMESLGLGLVGPQAPDGGQQATPWPDELPETSKNVPTYRTRQADPRSATRQLDFVFASTGLKRRMRVRALNSDEKWGPSDHCRVLIELDD